MQDLGSTAGLDKEIGTSSQHFAATLRSLVLKHIVNELHKSMTEQLSLTN